MKSNTAGKDMWLLAQTANELLDVDDVQALSVYYVTQVEAISQQ